MGQNVDEVTKVNSLLDIVWAASASPRSTVGLLLVLARRTALSLAEKCMNDAVAKWVDGQLRNPQKILPRQIALLLFVQARETAIQSLNLIGGD